MFEFLLKKITLPKSEPCDIHLGLIAWNILLSFAPAKSSIQLQKSEMGEIFGIFASSFFVKIFFSFKRGLLLYVKEYLLDSGTSL